MFLKRIEISNYRQLSHIVLDFQKDLTVLAGPNNSGKTTLISVLKGIFNDNKLTFLYSDVPTNLSVDWVDKIMPIFKSIMVANAKDTGVSEIIKAISIDDQFSLDYIIDEFRAQIEVEYIPETDDIQNFVDYLMDLDESDGKLCRTDCPSRSRRRRGYRSRPLRCLPRMPRRLPNRATGTVPNRQCGFPCPLRLRKSA